MDAEWKPVFQAGSSSRLSILQIATWDYVYIIDIIKLQSLPNMNWHLIVDRLFMNEGITKLGT